MVRAVCCVLSNMKLGFIGLGRMGARMAGKLLKEGHEVIAWNRSDHELKNIESIEKLIKSLEAPRVIWSMLPAGEATEEILKEISKFTEIGDIVIDGGNAFYKDTQKRFDNFKKKGIKFLGIGVSGGVVAVRQGYPIMVGGDRNAYEYIIPILNSLAKPSGGHEYFGQGGAGHFVKMIHNGIEYGIMQSLSEGFEVLEKAPYKFDLLKVGKLWQKGTLVSGFLLDRAVDAFSEDKNLSGFSGPVSESGEARWTVEQAKEEKVNVEIIERSLEFRNRSKKDKKIQKSFTAKMLNALRFQFGRHEILKK